MAADDGAGRRRHPGAGSRLGCRAGQPDRRTTSSAPAASGSARAWCCCSRARWASTGAERFELAAIVEFIHTATLLHDDVVDESGAASRPRDGQCAVRQRRQRAGRRLPVLARLPDDGLGEPHARAGSAGRCDQRDRRGRGAAADEHARPRPGGRRLPARDPLQDRQAVRSQRPAGRRARRGRSRTSRRPAPTTAGPGHGVPADRRCAGLRRRDRRSSARTSATTCARASRRCRC